MCWWAFWTSNYLQQLFLLRIVIDKGSLKWWWCYAVMLLCSIIRRELSCIFSFSLFFFCWVFELWLELAARAAPRSACVWDRTLRRQHHLSHPSCTKGQSVASLAVAMFATEGARLRGHFNSKPDELQCQTVKGRKAALQSNLLSLYDPKSSTPACAAAATSTLKTFWTPPKKCCYCISFFSLWTCPL